MNSEFYEDEVIEGFYVPSMLKKAWGVQMDVLSETDRICRKHDIPYFADWGTLLATIRHNGYIPWDDDLDISMRRRDYERFLAAAETELPEGFKVMNFKNHPGHHFFVARIVGNSRICFDEEHLKRFHGFPYIAGIDLFVLDNVCKDRKKEKLKSKKAEFVVTLADKLADENVDKNEAEELLKTCEEYTGRKIDRSLSGETLRIFMYGLAEELFASIPDEESDALVQMMPFGMYGNERYIPKEYYRETVRLPYMYTTMSVPICYDAVMRMKFGDYMQIHRTWNGHDYPFFYGQHESLLSVLDFEYPSYKASAKDLISSPERLPGIKELSECAMQEIKNLAKDLLPGDLDTAAALQQAAFDLGTQIESVYGEGYGPVHVLENICEFVYRAGSGDDVSSELEDALCELDILIKEKITSRRDIVIMPFAGRYWKYLEPVYNMYKNDPGVNVHVVPIPYYYKEYDGVFAGEVFDTDSYPPGVVTADHGSFDLEGMHPYKLIIQNPFDEWNSVFSVPKRLYSCVIRKFTDELVYIPFFVTDDFTKEQEREFTNMDAYVCVPGVINADRIILPSETLKNTYIDKITDFVKSEDVRPALEKKIEVSSDLVYKKEEDSRPENGAAKTVLYLTTVSFLAENGKSGIEKIRRVTEVFRQNTGKIKVIWATQCCDDLTIIDNGVAGDFREATEEFKISGIGEFISDIRPDDYEDIVKKCDAYYGDPSALALKFFYDRKPVMIINANV